jgi:hypothetical protein
MTGNIEYSDDFKKFVNRGYEESYYIGTGYPNAQILMIGKESAISEENKQGQLWYHRNAAVWKDHIKNKTCEYLEYEVEKSHPLYKNWESRTWNKYQKLSDYIFEKDPKKYHVDFLKHMFTSELNDAPALNTASADKSGLNERKLLFKESEFIQQFPVVVLACSNYIKNNDKIREIDEVFNVTYDGDKTGKFWYTKHNWFFTHHNAERTKLVIHTRQLSANVKEELLNDMGRVIRKHLKSL